MTREQSVPGPVPEKTMQDLEALLEIARCEHARLCPRIILGTRIGLAGLGALGLQRQDRGKHVLAIVECDGCFVDGVTAATGCTVGHRTLRVEDYGKVAATLVHVTSGRGVRVAPVLDVREKAATWARGEPRHYFAQLQAYREMPDDMLLTVTPVELAVPVSELVSRPGVRVDCEACGEEIINERELISGGRALCRACAGQAYYRIPVALPALSPGEPAGSWVDH